MVFHRVNCKADKFTAGARQSLFGVNFQPPALPSAWCTSLSCTLVIICFIVKSAEKWRKISAAPHVGFLQQWCSFFLLFVSVLLTRCFSAMVRLWCFFFFLLLLFFPVSSWKFSWGPWKKYAFFVSSYNIQSVLEKMFPMHCGLNPSSISVSAKHFVLLRWKLYIF